MPLSVFLLSFSSTAKKVFWRKISEKQDRSNSEGDSEKKKICFSREGMFWFPLPPLPHTCLGSFKNHSVSGTLYYFWNIKNRWFLRSAIWECYLDKYQFTAGKKDYVNNDVALNYFLSTFKVLTVLFRISRRGNLKNNCSENFCKILRKNPLRSLLKQIGLLFFSEGILWKFPKEFSTVG